jgi:hypothetical protein
VIDGDTTNNKANNADLPHLTKEISADYSRFRNLLNEKNKPIIVFEKEFLKQIESAYQ